MATIEPVTINAKKYTTEILVRGAWQPIRAATRVDFEKAEVWRGEATFHGDTARIVESSP